MKILKAALLAVAALTLLVVGAVAYLALTFEPRDYQPRIVQWVKQNTGRTLDVRGALELTFWPDIAIRLGRVSLTERESNALFADVEDARFSVKLLPLISGALVANDLRLAGAHVRITRYEDGRFNIEDLLKSQGGDVRFDIGRILVERSGLSYADLRAGTRYELSGIRLDTGRIASGIESPVSVAFSATDQAHVFDLAALAKGQLTFDVRQQTVALRNVAFDVKGRIADFNGLTANGKGSLEARGKAGEVTATGVAVTVGGAAREETLTATLQAPNISFAAKGARFENVALEMRATGAAGTTHIKLGTPRLQQAGNALTSDVVSADLDLDRGGHRVTAAATTRMQADLQTRRLVFDEFKSSFNAGGQRLPKGGISGALTGVATIDALKQGIQLRLAGHVGESHMKAELALAGFAAPVYRFAVNIDKLDIDRYTSGAAAQRGTGAALDLSPLSTLPASGTLQIGELRSAGLKAIDVKLALKP